MKLLLITGVYPTPRRPTKGTFNRELVAGLRAAGDDVRVVAPVPWTDVLRAPKAMAPEDRVSYPPWFYPPRVGHVAHHRWMRATVLRAVRGMTAKWRPDIVLGYWTHPDGTVALEAARRLGVPGVLLVGGSDIRLLTADPARRDIILKTLDAADLVLTVGDALRERVLALGVTGAPVESFRRGVDAARFSPGAPDEARRRLGLPLDRVVFLWVGRMVPVKGLDVLLAAWRNVAAPAATPPLLVLVGDGEERAALERAAAPDGDTVRFVGSVAHQALADWYRAADAVVLPSRSEGVPNVLLEGLACGTPFIASAVGGVPDLLEPSSETVPAGDAGALAAALSRRVSAGPMCRRATGTVPGRADAIADLRDRLRAVREARPAAVPEPAA